MTDDLPIDDEERQAIESIAPLNKARRDKNEATRRESLFKPGLTAFLLTLPEGERELWDDEHGEGVALRDTGGARWVDTSELDDATLLAAVRRGVLTGFNPQMWDALIGLTDAETARFVMAFRPAIKQGGGQQLVSLRESERSDPPSLPERRQQ